MSTLTGFCFCNFNSRVTLLMKDSVSDYVGEDSVFFEVLAGGDEFFGPSWRCLFLQCSSSSVFKLTSLFLLVRQYFSRSVEASHKYCDTGGRDNRISTIFFAFSAFLSWLTTFSRTNFAKSRTNLRDVSVRRANASILAEECTHFWILRAKTSSDSPLKAHSDSPLSANLKVAFLNLLLEDSKSILKASKNVFPAAFKEFLFISSA